MNNGSKENKTPRLSVVMPVYNTSEYLAESIESVLYQTFRDFELILVDDGSTDNSLEICRKYEKIDGRVTVISQENQGPGATRNNGIERASAQLLMLLDSDDTAAPDMIEKAMDVMSESDPDLLLFGYEEIFFSESGKEKSRLSRQLEQLDLRTAEECRAKYCKLVFDAFLNQPWNKVYKKSIIDTNNIRFPNVRRTQDAIFNGEYFKHINSMYAIPEPLYFFRQNNMDKVWRKFPRDSYKIDINYNSFIENTLREFGRFSGEDRRLADKWFFNTIFRDAGYYRNPNWALGSKEKKAYVEEVISDEYNVNRAENAVTSDKKTERVKRRVLSRDAAGLMRDIRYDAFKTKVYDFYSRTLRRMLKRG